MKLKLKRTETGFTLIELMLTIAVIAIIASIATPPMKQLMVNMRMNQATETIRDALEQARAESFTTQQQVSVQVSGNVVTITSRATSTTSRATSTAGYLHPSIIVRPQPAVAAGVYFNRGIPQTTTGTPLGQTNTSYEICYRNEKVQKQMVKLEGYNTITVIKNSGAC